MNNVIEAYRQAASASLDTAESLPFESYHQPDVYQLEADRIFSNDWVFVCAEQELANPGDYYALSLAGEAIAIIRGEDGQLRVMSNNCRHRGTPLLDEGFGKLQKNIVCPYHAWTYNDQGELKGVPFPGNTPVDKASHCLPRFHIESWLGLVFVNLADNPRSLAERLGHIGDYTAIFEPETFDRCSQPDTDNWQANWKLVMENGMESYHLFKVHKQTLETITPTKTSFYVTGSAEWTLTAGEIKGYSGSLMKWLMGSYPEAWNHYMLISVPPSMIAILDKESLSWLCVLPQGPDETRVRSGYLSSKSSGKESKSSKSFTQAFFAEDKVICERVQRGMSSRKGKGGKLVEMERIIVDFHQFLASRLFGSDTDNPFSSEHTHLFKK
ncbi:aromatic ring-hydroxylating oxygenase subunit alpha [Spongorhabdus nitratireducens]